MSTQQTTQQSEPTAAELASVTHRADLALAGTLCLFSLTGAAAAVFVALLTVGQVTQLERDVLQQRAVLLRVERNLGQHEARLIRDGLLPNPGEVADYVIDLVLPEVGGERTVKVPYLAPWPPRDAPPVDIPQPLLGEGARVAAPTLPARSW